MNVRNCKKCGRLYNYVAGPMLCPLCREELEATFQKVKKYVDENKGASVQQVVEECEVEIQQIREWIREERLEFSEGSSIGVACEKCGASIRTGRFCDKCKAEMTSGLQSVLDANKPKPAPERIKDSSNNPRMRFLQ